MYLSIYLTIELATDLSLYLDTNLQSPACIWIEDWRLKIPQKLFPQIFNPPNLRGGLAIRRKNPVESSIWRGKGFHPSTHSIPFHPSVHPSYPSTHTVHPSILSVHLHIYLPSYLFTYLSTNLSTYLSFHPSIYLIHWCCIKISYICQQYCCKISSIWNIYIYMHTSKISSSWVTRNKTYCTCTARNYITLSTVLCHLASEYQRENSILPCCAMLQW